jgi:hypothetical protein
MADLLPRPAVEFLERLRALHDALSGTVGHRVCHPYDVRTALIAEQAEVALTDGAGARIEPILLGLLRDGRDA